MKRSKKNDLFSKKNFFMFRDLVDKARKARKEDLFGLSAYFYDEALNINKENFNILMQAGHMHKESKSFAEAEKRYLKALNILPENPEIHLQLGHFYKTVGRYKRAMECYEKAVQLAPQWDMANAELQHIQESSELKQELTRQRAGRCDGRIDTALFPKKRDELLISHQDAFICTRSGMDRITKWGRGLTVQGVDCLRGFVVSDIPHLNVEIFLDGELIFRDHLKPALQRRERSNPNIKKYVYNAWIDFSPFPRGWHDLSIKTTSVNGRLNDGQDWFRTRVIVADPFPEEAYDICDGLVPPPDPKSPLSLPEQINARPSIVHKASTHSLDKNIERVAVLRVDQLGDMTASVPALEELRRILPNAHITGIITSASEVLARSMGVFDEIILINFPDDKIRRQRVMDSAEQTSLIQKLSMYNFDIAIDFSIAGEAYKLLPHINAPITMGFGRDGLKTLDLVVETHDAKSGNDIMRHSARTRTLVDALSVCLNSGSRVIRRSDLNRSVLCEYGLEENEDYVVLHSGARVKFTRWPGFADLTAKIVRSLNKKVIYMSDGDSPPPDFPEDVKKSGKLIFLNQQLPFDNFDALLSFCQVFVGNDSGPKHLAGLRGSKVISLHSARTDWREWGQEQSGVIMSRKVPCAGCSLNQHFEECCYDAVCVKNISVDEVYEQFVRILDEQVKN